MRGLKKSVVLMVVLLTMVSLLAGCGAPDKADEQVIKIGANMDLSGGGSTFGTSVLNGVKMAVEEVNAAGGINGKQIKLFVEDNKTEPAEAANTTKKLIEQDQVDLIIGAVTSGCTLSSAPIAQASGVPMITPTSTNPQVTETGDYIFRSCFIDPLQGTAMAKFAAEKLKAKTAVIMGDVTSDYSKGLTEVFKKDFEAAGGKVLSVESFAQKDTDFNAQLTKIKAEKPDVIFLPAYYTEVGLILKQARQQGIDQPFIGTDGWDSPKLVEIAGNATNNGYFTNHYATDDQDPVIQGFIKKYKDKYNQVPDAFATLGYEATLIAVKALEKAGSTDKKAVRDAMAATKDVPGITGKISLDANRNPIKAVTIIEMKDGKQTFLDKINP
ncbi:MAG: ABC transporter substrate-binding protein [bacterium]